jgi:riboflavin kinase/FMN adenylyltransferase
MEVIMITHWQKHELVKLMVVGFNFRFGAGRVGTVETLMELGKKYGIDIEVMKPTIVQVEGENVEVSSTIIRELINTGEVSKASVLLNRYYSLEGTVVQGNQKGRELGYKTANLQLKKNQVVPLNGGYATVTLVDGEFYNSATYIGTRPTFDGKERSIETHIINQDLVLYNKTMEVYFIDKIAEDKKFETVKGLSDNIKQAVLIAEEKLAFVDFSKLF